MFCFSEVKNIQDAYWDAGSGRQSGAEYILLCAYYFSMIIGMGFPVF